ncbi:TMAO reductase system periplasmic protein TorT [Rheinheimera sp.]|uniref:TMAO reductase system periplasmic protein TorT n=1 Tax=Rheinheimera sp. TaxID=1869214 RepID=UPI00307EC6F4
MYWLLLLFCPLLWASDWFPAPVVADGQPQSYQPLAMATHPWRLCALLPHGKDHYWWGVSWGLQQEAERQGVLLGIYEAGGYEHLDRQRQQLQNCLAQQADALIIGAISSHGLNDLLLQAKQQGLVLIDLINGISSDRIDAHSSVSFADMVDHSLNYLLSQQVQPQHQLAWLPGPAQAAWVQDAEQGLKRRENSLPWTLIHAGYGAPDKFSQATLVRQLFRQHKPDYVLANAVAAAVAAEYLQNHPEQHTGIVSFYTNPDVVQLLENNQLLAAATDSPVLQARIAVDLAIRALEQRPYPKQVSPQIRLLTASSIKELDLQQIIAPRQQWMIRQQLPALTEQVQSLQPKHKSPASPKPGTM